MDNINFKGFTAIDNSILFDSNISDSSKIFLMKVSHILSTKQENFNPCKDWLLKVCNITKSMYEKVMKELKDYIELVKVRKGSKYEYTYKLLKDIFTPVEKANKNQIKEKMTLIKGQQFNKACTFTDFLIYKLTPSEERVYRCLMLFLEKDKSKVSISQQNIADKTGINLRTVQRILKALVEKKFIEIEKKKEIMGHYNEYRLLVFPSNML